MLIFLHECELVEVVELGMKADREAVQNLLCEDEILGVDINAEDWVW